MHNKSGVLQDMHNTSGTLVSETIIEEEKALRRTQTATGSSWQQHQPAVGYTHRYKMGKAKRREREDKKQRQKDDNTNWRCSARTQSLGQAECAARRRQYATRTHTYILAHTDTLATGNWQQECKNGHRQSAESALKHDLVLVLVCLWLRPCLCS